jgi:hypothetical protein
MTALDEFQIRKALKCHPQFVGCYAADELPKKLMHGGLVVNTDARNMPGTHWNAIYVNKNGVGEFFDSYGLPPIVPQHKKYLNMCKYWRNSPAQLQSMSSSVCGHYSILYLDARFHGVSLQKFLNRRMLDGVHSNDASAIIAFKNKFVATRKGHRGQICCCKLQLQSRIRHGRVSA